MIINPLPTAANSIKKPNKYNVLTSNNKLSYKFLWTYVLFSRLITGSIWCIGLTEINITFHQGLHAGVIVLWGGGAWGVLLWYPLPLLGKLPNKIKTQYLILALWMCTIVECTGCSPSISHTPGKHGKQEGCFISFADISVLICCIEMLTQNATPTTTSTVPLYCKLTTQQRFCHYVFK